MSLLTTPFRAFVHSTGIAWESRGSPVTWLKQTHLVFCIYSHNKGVLRSSFYDVILTLSITVPFKSLDFVDSCTQAAFEKAQRWAISYPTELMASDPASSISFDPESEFYYSGLYSSTRIVYRTGPTPWKRPTGPEAYRPLKELRPVFGHKINEVWEDLGPKVCQLLDSKELLWTSIDVVRFKVDDGAIGPVILWIGVVPETLSVEDARTSASGCLDLLKETGIADVEVEFRSSIYTRSAGPSLLEQVWDSDPTVDVRRPLTTGLGLCISAEGTPCVEGTGGVYLAEGGGSENILLVTARHVLFPKGPNYDYTYKDTSAHRRNVLLLGTRRFEEFIESIKVKAGWNANSVDYYDDKIKALKEKVVYAGEDEDQVAQAQRKLEETQSLHKKTIEALEKFHGEVRRDWSHPKQRILGHVVRSPPITVNADTGGFVEDYAIVALDRFKIEKNFNGNVIDLGTEIPIGEFCSRMDPCHEHKTFNYPMKHLFPLQGIMTEELMLSPDTRDRQGEPCRSVIKKGSTTGLTIGRANGVYSFVRQYFENNTRQTSKEWAILPYDKKSGVFSAPGDSGSVVVGGDGQVGGIITGGAGTMDDFDITYATPFFWLFARIKANGFPNACLYPQVDVLS